jgi:shikimate kinase
VKVIQACGDTTNFRLNAKRAVKGGELASNSSSFPFQPKRSTAYFSVSSAKSIVLIGMMGAGKSSVGRCLERRTGLRRFDTDEIVSERLGRSIPEIFTDMGEEQFRRAETEALSSLNPAQPAIIVTGGGIILRDENVQHLKRLGIVVWLQAEEDTLFARAARRGNRPLLETDDPRRSLAKIAAERAPLYARASDVRVDTTNRGHEEIADLILSEMEDRTVGAK